MSRSTSGPDRAAEHPAGEQLDIVDAADGRYLGTARRHEVHDGGHWHEVFHCLIVRPSVATVVLQERAAGKASFPGLLDLSATGHLMAGERPEAGVRELTEELGVVVGPERLVPLGVRLLADNGGEGRNRERTHVHLLPDDRPVTAYRPDPAEVSALVEAGVDELIECFDGAGAPARRVALDGTVSAVTITAADLVPAIDGYWIVLLVMVQRYLAGQRPLAI